MKQLLTLPAALVAVSLCLTPPVQAAAVDYFLKIEATPGKVIEGGSDDPQHAGEIEVLSFSWGVSQRLASDFGAGASRARSTFSGLQVVKQVDKASPLLFMACANGQRLAKATLVCRNGEPAGGTDKTVVTPPGEFLIITLTDVLISSISTATEDTDDPNFAVTERCTLNFSKIEWTFQPADGEAVKGGYDLKLNKKL